MIRLFHPDLGEEELKAVAETFATGWTALGPKVAEFEKRFGEYVCSPYCVGTNSCTSALDLALKLIGIGPGDEVIVPTITFVSTAHTVVYNGARPVFCDVDRDTLLMSLEDVMTKVTEKTKAVIVVHYGGTMVDVAVLRKLLPDRVKIVEDCAHAMGSSLWDAHAGTLGDIGCFSFQSVKNLSAGDGGMLVTADEEMFQRAKRLRWLGIDKGTWDRTGTDRSYWWEYQVDEIGLKCHMNDITASIGLVQLKKLDRMNKVRAEAASLYRSRLSGVGHIVQVPYKEIEGMTSSNHLFCIKAEFRDELSTHLNSVGINTGVHYKPIHLYKCYGFQPRLPVAESEWKYLLSLPMHSMLSLEEIETVVAEIGSFYTGKYT